MVEVQEITLIEDDVDIQNHLEKTLVLHNDDYHTFDYVIEALVDVCNHSLEQAEQCTYLVHYRGKSEVKKGAMRILKPMKEALVGRDLRATID